VIKSDLVLSEKSIIKKIGQVRLLYSLSLTCFFIYFFLDSTHVLQALLGGY